MGKMPPLNKLFKLSRIRIQPFLLQKPLPSLSPPASTAQSATVESLETESTNDVPEGPTDDPNYTKGVIWFENVFPFKTSYINIFDLTTKRSSSAYEEDLMLKDGPLAKGLKLIPREWPKAEAKFKVVRVEANLKEGGLYLEYKYKGGTSEEALETLQNYLKDTNATSLFNLKPINAFQVKGRPWIEDLVSRVPSRRLHIEFYGPDLTVEDLYREFRMFGKIVDINLQKSSDKEVPRYASVQFLRKRAATSARNCIHGEQFGSTRLAIGYEVNQGWRSKFYTWLTANSRVSILLLFGFATGLSFLIFDPLRVFSVTNAITGRYSIVASRWFNTFQHLLTDVFSVPQKSEAHQWTEREAQTIMLAALLRQVPDSTVLVSGPKGSGKSAFVDEASSVRANRLVIRCDDLVGKGDYSLLSHLSSQVNFFPTFGFVSQLGGYLDTIVTATTGAKANLATTNEGEVRMILDCVTQALQKVVSQQLKAREVMMKTQDDKATFEIE